MKTCRPDRRHARTSLAAAAWAFALAGAAPWGAAQSCFPPELTESSQPDVGKIKQCVDSQAAGLAGDPDQIKKSRNQLSAPFEAPARTSVKFRIEVGRLLSPVLGPLTADKQRDVVASNALQLAGEVGTVECIALLPAGLKDDRA